jgi:hypothetical protein
MLGQLHSRTRSQAHLATSGGTRPVAAFIENCRPQCVSAVAVTRASFGVFFLSALRTPVASGRVSVSPLRPARPPRRAPRGSAPPPLRARCEQCRCRGVRVGNPAIRIGKSRTTTSRVVGYHRMSRGTGVTQQCCIPCVRCAPAWGACCDDVDTIFMLTARWSARSSA